MSAREDLEAALTEAQARVYAATPGPWTVADHGLIDSPGVRAGWYVAILPQKREYEDNAALIVAAVNREQRAINHARDVMARHRGDHWCPRFDADGESAYSDWCPDPDDCPEITSLHALWVTP